MAVCVAMSKASACSTARARGMPASLSASVTSTSAEQVGELSTQLSQRTVPSVGRTKSDVMPAKPGSALRSAGVADSRSGGGCHDGCSFFGLPTKGRKPRRPPPSSPSPASETYTYSALEPSTLIFGTSTNVASIGRSRGRGPPRPSPGLQIAEYTYPSLEESKVSLPEYRLCITLRWPSTLQNGSYSFHSPRGKPAAICWWRVALASNWLFIASCPCSTRKDSYTRSTLQWCSQKVGWKAAVGTEPTISVPGFLWPRLPRATCTDPCGAASRARAARRWSSRSRTSSCLWPTR
mmetsp:Transcript_22326/g.65469  ORF Transcript_22326/g.65469 Transcript_22326/m.65469 type:complete len:294 (-) Transcript_22326:608-1489(-)